MTTMTKYSVAVTVTIYVDVSAENCEDARDTACEAVEKMIEAAGYDHIGDSAPMDVDCDGCPACGD